MLKPVEEQLIISEIKNTLGDLIAVYIFGSQARGDQTATSDIDIGFACEKSITCLEVWECAGNIAALLNRDIDLVDFSNCPIALAFEGINQGQLIFDSGNASHFELRIFNAYHDWYENVLPHLNDAKERYVHG